MTDQVEARCAVVDETGLVVNVIICLPSDLPPDGCTLIEVMNDQRCAPNYKWDGTEFIYGD